MKLLISLVLVLVASAASASAPTEQNVKCDISTYFCPGTINVLIPRIQAQNGWGLVTATLMTTFPNGGSSTQYGWPLTASQSVLNQFCGTNQGHGTPMTNLTCTISGSDLTKIVDKDGKVIGQ